MRILRIHPVEAWDWIASDMTAYEETKISEGRLSESFDFQKHAQLAFCRASDI